LKKGQEVDVEEQGNELVVRTEKKINNDSKRVNIDEILPVSRRYINALYRRGVDEIEIHYNKEHELEGIKKALNNELSTFEIVKKDGKICLVKSISEVEEREIDNLIRRTLILLKEMVTDLEEAYDKKNKEKLKDILELEALNNRLTNVLRRAINKSGYKHYQNTILIYLLVDQLEKAADELRDFSLTFDLKSKNVRELLTSLEKFFSLFYDVFYNFSNEKISEFETQGMAFIKKCKNLMEKENSLEIHHLLTSCELIYNQTTSLLFIHL
jgi:hypothetical protein